MNQEELPKLKNEFTNKLSEIESIHKQQIEAERNILLSSWRWRIGNFQVNLILAIRDFFLKIYRVISRSKYKVSGINHHTNRRNSNRRESVYYPDTEKPTLACIFDTFTHSCFQPEFNIISPFPDNWKYILRKFDLEALFCESAWAGNDASWRFLIGDIGGLKKKGLTKMLEAFRKKGLPTIFWNKEDPVHFDHFIEDARHFDYIFTTDQNIIPKYREVVNHDRIFPLPFAAQEKIHNPVRTEERNGSVCFAGTWYAAKYAERIIDMETILNPAMDFGLEIYDRNYGATRYEKVMYGFPDIYQPFIKGKLDYAEMVRAYKNYKVFLNVNSVRYSPSMFSRRVFELLACGTPVISTWSEGISNLIGDDIVLFTESEKETQHHLETLLSDNKVWWSHSLKGIRKVLENHTYGHRTREIFEKTGLPIPDIQPQKFIIVCMVDCTEDVQYLASLINNQSYRNLEVLLICDQPEQINPVLNEISESVPIELIGNKPEYMAHILRKSETVDAVSVINKNNFYGRHYIRDIALAFKYSDAEVVGKRSCFKLDKSGNISLEEKGWEYRFTNELQPGSLAIKASMIDPVLLSKLLNGENLHHDTSVHFSIDSWNFIVNGRNVMLNLKQSIEI